MKGINAFVSQVAGQILACALPQGVPLYSILDGFARAEANNGAPLLARAIRSATTSSDVMTNNNARGAHFVISVTAAGGGGSTVTPVVYCRCPGLNVAYPIITGPAIDAAGLYVLRVYPGLTEVANYAVSDVLARYYYIQMQHSAATSWNYGVNALTIL